MKFLVQTVNKEIVHDFVFHLIEAIKFNNWYHNERKYQYCLCEDLLEYDFSEYIPIGSIEFVLEFYKIYHNIDNIKPINIPQELREREYLGRVVGTIEDLQKVYIGLNNYVFIKSINRFKGITDIVKLKEVPVNEPILISETIDILSEWRGFVFKGELLDIRNYSGDFRIFPDIQAVEKMIRTYNKPAEAYTVDVAVNNNGDTVLIEIHQFFSCGLYGFNNYKVLPQMFIATHRAIMSLKKCI